MNEGRKFGACWGLKPQESGGQHWVAEVESRELVG